MNEKPQPEYRENPNPKQAYRVTMTIKDAPGPFGMIVGFTQYDVANQECLPPPKDNPGGYTSSIPTHSPEFVLQKESEGVYTGTIHTDGMIDEDYHGRGICHWELQNVQMQLKATGAKSETLFMADLYGHEVLAGQAKTLYYIKKGYPRHPESTIDEPLSSGQTDRSRMASYLTDDDLFTITLSAREVTPSQVEEQRQLQETLVRTPDAVRAEHLQSPEIALGR